jgi:hypothetical protein
VSRRPRPRAGSPVRSPATLPAYERQDGVIPVVHAAGMKHQAAEVRRLLEAGTGALSALLNVEPPELDAFLVADEDWNEAPRENARAYPPGLPYFTRSIRPPALVLPATLSPAFRPRTQATYSLIVWHELAHAFLLRREVVRTPAWLRELVPQAASAAVARRTRLPLEDHLNGIDREPGFTIRDFGGHVDASEQMAFQNLLLLLGAVAVEEFGDGFLQRLVNALWEETDVVNEERAEELLANALGPGGREWLALRPEF